MTTSALVFDVTADLNQIGRRLGAIPAALLVHPSLKFALEAAIEATGGQHGNDTRSRPLVPSLPLGIRVFTSVKVDRDVFYAGSVEQIVKYLKELEAV